MKREFTWPLYNEPEITGQGYVMCKIYRKNNNNEIKAEIQYNRDKEKAGWITFHLSLLLRPAGSSVFPRWMRNASLAFLTESRLVYNFSSGIRSI